MAGNEPDTPGKERKENPRERSTFSIEDGPGIGEGLDTEQGYDAPDQNVFDLTMDYSDDETLLDWEQYAGQRKFYFLGMDCSLVARFCPFMPCVPKEWYHRYSKTQRKWMTIGASSFIGLLVLLVGATVLLSLLPGQQSDLRTTSECSWNNYHLPQTLKPSQYNLDIDVELQSPYTVTGQMEIMVDVVRETDCMVLHAMGMTLSNVKRLDTGDAGSWSFNDKEQVILKFPQDISGPSLAISLEFEYTLKQGLSGFYRSNYTDGNGDAQTMATTQMEANSARKAFPCFDEPALKAKWNVSITADSEQTVLFNMPAASQSNTGSGRILHDFEVTPPMSSYLVAFIVGKLERVSQSIPYPDGSGSPRLLSIYGTPERKDSLLPALEIAAKVLPEYERLFGVPYALPKLDLVAIPDFAAGAMENWGLITYRETDLLLSADDSSIQNERRVALVIAHEMTHLWFGDLVTMKDWGELWLNEGFATYFENIGATVARPNMAYLETFYSGLATTALERDALAKSTHPLATLTGMDTAEKVESMFDGISYDKGAAVLRMLRAYLDRDMDPQPLMRRHLLQASQASDNFLASLQLYLKKYQYNSTTSNDLWAEFDTQTGMDITAMMRSWTFQSGFPRVQILLEGNQLQVYQRPFEISPDPSGGRPCDASKAGVVAGNAPWWIPLAKSSRDNISPSWTTLSTCLLDTPIYTLQDEDDWIKLNAGQYGLYRVNYPVSLWQKLAKAAAEQAEGQAAPAIPAADLAGLLDDSWALSQAKETPVVHFLNLLKSLSQRQLAEYAPWSVASLHLVGIRSYLEQFNNQECTDRWSSFVRQNLTEPFMADKPQLSLLYTPSGGAQPDVQARLLRTLLAGVSAEFNVTLGLQEALTLFEASSGNYSSIDADIRGNVYAYVAASGRQASYDAVKRIYSTVTDPNEKTRALGALAYAESPELTSQTLRFAISEYVRAQDTTSLIARVAYRGSESLLLAWNFVRENYVEIANKLGGEQEAANAMGKLVSSIASDFASERAIIELKAVFEQRKKYLTQPRLRESAEESIRANMEWLRDNAQPICDWLKH